MGSAQSDCCPDRREPRMPGCANGARAWEAAVTVLSDRDMRILAFERSWWRLAGAKERDILEIFEVPVTRYYQLLNELIDRPEAAEFDPVIVTRLRRQRSRRQRLRSARPD